MKIVATTTKGKSTSRTLNVTVTPAADDPALGTNAIELWVAPGETTTIHKCKNLGLVQKVLIAGKEAAFEVLDEGTALKVTAPSDLANGDYDITLVDGSGNVVKSAQEVMLAAAQKMAATIAKNAPIAVRNCKKAINEGLDADMDQAVVIEEKLFGDCFETEDQKYGMAFFLDKNKEKVKEPFKNC